MTAGLPARTQGASHEGAIVPPALPPSIAPGRVTSVADGGLARPLQ